MEKDLLSSGEAAEYLGISEQRVRELGASGKVSRERFGRFWLYNKFSLDAWKNAPKSKGGRPKSGALARSRPTPGAFRT
jgi:excisionase family DNA binding protein